MRTKKSILKRIIQEELAKIIVESQGYFLNNYRWFKKKYPEFEFDNFYAKLKDAFGADFESKYLPNRGADYKFGPEHMSAWNALRKSKGLGTDTVIDIVTPMASSPRSAQSSAGMPWDKPGQQTARTAQVTQTAQFTPLKPSARGTSACSSINMIPVSDRTPTGKRFVDGHCHNVFKGPVPGYAKSRGSGWFNLDKAVGQILWLYCTKNVRAIFGVANEQHKNVAKAISEIRERYGIADLQYVKGRWNEFGMLAEIIKSNTPVYIHCTWGVHRSSAVTAGALMVSKGMCVEEATKCADLRYRNFKGGEKHKYIKTLRTLESPDCRRQSFQESKNSRSKLEKIIRETLEEIL